MHQDHNHSRPPVTNANVESSTTASIHQENPPAEREDSFVYTPSVSARPTESPHTRGDSLGRNSSLGRNNSAFSPRPHDPPQPRHQVEDEHEPDDIHSALRHNGANRTSASSAWGVYDGAVNQRATYSEAGGYNPSVFSEPPIPGMGPRHGSFGGLGGNNPHGTTIQGSEVGGMSGIRIPSRGPEEIVTVSVLPEKEGMFMFQHRNYQIASARRGSRVVRRYSDFVW